MTKHFLNTKSVKVTMNNYQSNLIFILITIFQILFLV